MNPVETGFYYLQSRYYDPESCRFLSADAPAMLGLSATKPTGANLYTYCFDNPLNKVDPTGYYAVDMYLTPTLIDILSSALYGIMAGISASITSIQTAIATSLLPVIAIAAVAVAIVGIMYTVKCVEALSASAEQTRAKVVAKVQAGGISKNNLRDYTVYVIYRNGTTDVEYVGITKNYDARYSAHKNGPRFNHFDTYKMIPIATGLTRSEARAMEQTIITAYGIGTLKNMINSISPKKWDNFNSEFNQMKNLIAAWNDPE